MKKRIGVAAKQVNGDDFGDPAELRRIRIENTDRTHLSTSFLEVIQRNEV